MIKDHVEVAIFMAAISIGVWFYGHLHKRAAVQYALPSVHLNHGVPSHEDKTWKTDRVPEPVEAAPSDKRPLDMDEESLIEWMDSIPSKADISEEVVNKLYQSARASAPAAMAAIGAIARAGTRDQLQRFFEVRNLPATAKAFLIEESMKGKGVELKRRAEQFMQEMIGSGSVAEVLAALPKVQLFTEPTVLRVAALQPSLCRFHKSMDDDLGFELVKAKFAAAVSREQGLRSWEAICGS